MKYFLVLSLALQALEKYPGNIIRKLELLTKVLSVRVNHKRHWNVRCQPVDIQSFAHNQNTIIPLTPTLFTHFPRNSENILYRLCWKILFEALFRIINLRLDTTDSWRFCIDCKNCRAPQCSKARPQLLLFNFRSRHRMISSPVH